MITAVYDISTRPITFDILYWIATVGAQAGDDPVKFVILADGFREKTTKDRALTAAGKMARVHRILAPCCWLLKNTAAVEVVTDPAEAQRLRGLDALTPSTFMASTVEQWRKGRDIFRLRAPGYALEEIGDRFDGAVVLTIRQSPVVHEKNSRLSSWLRLAGHIHSKGKRAVLIPDTASVIDNAALPRGCEWFPAAALDVGLRAAVYQRAALTMAMGAGPAGIPLFMPRSRYVLFTHHRGLASSSQIRSFEKVWGLSWGEQLPWSDGFQILDYRKDDEDALIEAFDKVIR